ncbi:sulfite exporter TauE/SafE family protein [Vibrio rhizosphaerae]|uniref:Probable membrane transporter protein n=1 Tax=Vibrio rhizosphaerae TaxID=398736 RepID=A0ABU4IRG6_9VIBR|nr:sulfite exporter TauE/SafE family protein [Vibrio rhizosphaerae]MDW6091991.1 sulfite exporter TauE/SafE family protein [Vibrio rhizosphaerae]
MTITFVLLLIVLGAFVGVMAGLLGIGGGLIIVPALLFLFPHVGITPDIAMQVALATSLSCIILTSGSSALNHLRYGNIDLLAVKWLTPGIIVGGLMGATLADWMPSEYLPKVFGVIVFLLAIQMFLSIRQQTAKPMPGQASMILSGSFIGMIASLAGIGGGALSVPYLNKHGIEMRKAVGTSSFCGCIIALSGMVGFIWHGFSVKSLPAFSLGYVYLPALLFVSCTSMFTTKVGAKLATELPTSVLKKVFAVFLMFVSVHMLLR